MLLAIIHSEYMSAAANRNAGWLRGLLACCLRTIDATEKQLPVRQRVDPS